MQKTTIMIHVCDGTIQDVYSPIPLDIISVDMDTFEHCEPDMDKDPTFQSEAVVKPTSQFAQVFRDYGKQEELTIAADTVADIIKTNGVIDPVVRDLDWIETHHEMVTYIALAVHKEEGFAFARSEEQGTGGLYELGEELTDEFQRLYGGTAWGEDETTEKSYFDVIELFLEKKEEDFEKTKG